MFKDTKEGQTHYFGDGCGEPEHNKIICKDCFYRDRYEKKDYCKIIEEEHGGNIEANRTECESYLKKGTEPKWLCCVCKINTYGERSTTENRKIYCDDCYWKKSMREDEKEARIAKNLKIEKLRKILNGDKKKIKQVMDLYGK